MRGRIGLSLLVLLWSATVVAQATNPALLSLYFFQEGLPQRDVSVRIGAIEVGKTNEFGAFHAWMEPGDHTISLRNANGDIQRLEVELLEGERIRYIIAQPDVAQPPSYDVDSSLKATADADDTASDEAGVTAEVTGTATITGTVTSLEGNTPVPGARIFLSGIPGASKTDADGNFEIQVPAGTYAISYIHPDFSTQVFKQINLDPDQVVERSAALTPSGMDLGEHIVTAPRLEGGVLALMDERRNSSAVADVLSTDEISQAGDSNAADALKRVTGVTLVDGKYIYVRGLGERYSSNRLNNAGLPSPEPSRRVVPMDLFPTHVIGSMTIQKTYSPDLPGDFGGGNVLLKTKPVPEELSQKFKISLGGNSQTTGKSGYTYEGGSLDVLGIDDGERDLPGIAQAVVTDPERFNTNPLFGSPDAAENLEIAGESLKNNYDVERQNMLPDIGIEYSIGDRGESYASDWGWGYNLGVKLDNKSRLREETQNTYNVSNDVLSPADSRTRTRSENEINIGAMANVIFEIGADTTLESTTLVSRSTSKTVILDEGFKSENGLDFIETNLEWEERQLASQQFHGKHIVPSLNDLSVEWQWTLSQAKRDKPDTRFYSYTREADVEGDRYEYSLGTDGNQRRWESLTDDADSKSLDITYPFYDWLRASGQFQTGYMQEQKDRSSDVYKFNYYSTNWFTSPLSDLRLLENPEEMLTPDNITGDNSGFTLYSQTLPTDNYSATQDISAFYAKFNLDWNDAVQLMFGAREEKSTQKVETFDPESPDVKVKSKLSKRFLLPAVTMTYKPDDKNQIRLGVAQSINRPDLKELSQARYIDPDTRDSFIGNPNLKIAEILHYDLRWEKYLTSFDNFSIALFHKAFDNPIEETSKPGAGNIRSYDNAKSAVNSGIEFQGRVWLRRFFGQAFNSTYIEANAAVIDSEVDLGNTTTIGTNKKRSLQGQAPWVANLNIGYENLIKDEKLNFLINMSGDTLDSVGTEGLPDAYEVSDPTFDIVYSRLLWQGAEEKLNIKAKLNNITNPTFKIVRGDASDAPVEKEYKKGISFSVNLTYDWK